MSQSRLCSLAPYQLIDVDVLGMELAYSWFHIEKGTCPKHRLSSDARRTDFDESIYEFDLTGDQHNDD